MRLTVTLSLLIATAIMLLASVPHINAWERSNGYPYGHMCNSIFTGYVDTCR